MVRSWAFTVCCALSMVLVLLPSPWHWKARNTGTLLYIGWTVLGNFVFMVNSIIWAGNMDDVAPVWCDISTKIIIGMSVGLVAASLCINRRLYDISTIKTVSIDRDERRTRIIVDLILGVGLPMLVMTLSYVVQSNRYDIYEDMGCWPTTYPTLLAVPLVLMWPILLSVASLIYASLSIKGFLRARRQFNQALSSSHSGINMSRYFRLMGLSSGEILFSLPLSVYITYLNLTTTQFPWISWEWAHQNFSHVNKVPMVFIQFIPLNYRVLMINQWALPAGGFLFFLWFGFAGEALEAYKSLFYKIVKPFGIKPKTHVHVGHSQPSWMSRLTSGTSTTAREEARYPTMPEVSRLDTREDKSSYEKSSYKAHSMSDV